MLLSKVQRIFWGASPRVTPKKNPSTLKADMLFIFYLFFKLRWHWFITLYKFWVCHIIIWHLYRIHLPPTKMSFLDPPLLLSPSLHSPSPLVTTNLLSSSMRIFFVVVIVVCSFVWVFLFCFIFHIWVMISSSDMLFKIKVRHLFYYRKSSLPILKTPIKKESYS